MKKYGFNLKIVNPDFEVLEIQVENCIYVVKFSVKDVADIDYDYEASIWRDAGYKPYMAAFLHIFEKIKTKISIYGIIILCKIYIAII